MSEKKKVIGRYTLIYGVDRDEKKFLRIYKTTNEATVPDDLIYWHHSNSFLSHAKILHLTTLLKIIKSKSVGEIKEAHCDMELIHTRINALLQPAERKCGGKAKQAKEPTREPIPEPLDKSYDGLRKAANDYWHGIYEGHPLNANTSDIGLEEE